MSWSTLADRTLKTAISTFKTQGTYTRAAAPGSPFAIDGVFDRPDKSVTPGTDAAVQSTEITFGIRLADMPAAPAAGDAVLIGGVNFRVWECRPDGQGGADLVLEDLS